MAVANPPVRIYFPRDASETSEAFAKWHQAEQWDLSRFDKRLEEALGHFRQDFQEGLLSRHRLGAMFGFFGSFLPAYKIDTGAPTFPAYKIATLLPPEGTADTAAAPAVRIHFPRSGGEAAEAVEMIMQADRKPLADEKIPRGAKRPLVRGDERRPLKIRIVFGSEKRAQKNATERVPAKATVEKGSMDEQRPLKIRFVFASERRAKIVA